MPARRRLLTSAGAALGVALVAIVVVWLTYLAVDPRLRWSAPPDLPDPGGLRELAVNLLPLPQAYRDGMLVQFGFEARQFNGFLLGHAYRGARWYYLPAALVIKTPLGMLALWAAGAVTMALLPRLRTAALYVLPPAAVLLVAAMAGARNFGTRYAVFLPLFLAVAAGTVTLVARSRWRVGIVAALALWVATSSLRTFPYYLPYANEAFGGTAATHRHLHDSNVDWGQDLPRLAERLRARYPGERVWLVYKGAGVPSYYGIAAGNPLAVPPDQVRGLLVVSNSRVAIPGARLAELLATSTPVDQVGHSMTIYRR